LIEAEGRDFTSKIGVYLLLIFYVRVDNRKTSDYLNGKTYSRNISSGWLSG
jgi:hypothetical protein